MKGVLQN